MMVSQEYMREKLALWHPSWNVERFSDAQVKAIYTKETIAMVRRMEKYYSEK